MGTELRQMAIQLVRDLWIAVFAPEIELLLHSASRAVVQALRIVAREDQLDGREEALNIVHALVINALANGFGHVYGWPLELHHGERDAVDIEHDVGPLIVDALHGNFFGEGKIVIGPVVSPVDQLDGLFFRACADLMLTP